MNQSKNILCFLNKVRIEALYKGRPLEIKKPIITEKSKSEIPLSLTIMMKIRWRRTPSILPLSNTQCTASLSPLSKSLHAAWQQGRHRLSHQPAGQSHTIPSALLPRLAQPCSSCGWCKVCMRETCSSVPSQFLFAEMHPCLEIPWGLRKVKLQS